MNSPCLSGNVFLLSSFMKDGFRQIKNFWLIFFSFQHLEYVIILLSSYYHISDEKIAIIHIVPCM